MTTKTKRRPANAIIECWARDYEGTPRGLVFHLYNAARFGKHPKERPATEPQEPAEVRGVNTINSEILSEPHELPTLMGFPGWAVGVAGFVWIALTLFTLGWISASGGLVLLVFGPAAAIGTWYLVARSRVAPVLVLERDNGTAVIRWEWWLIENVLRLPAECRWVRGANRLQVIDRIGKAIAFDPTPSRPPEATSEDFGVAVEQTAIGGLVKAQTKRQEVMETIQVSVMFGMVGLLALVNFLMISRILDDPK